MFSQVIGRKVLPYHCVKMTFENLWVLSRHIWSNFTNMHKVKPQKKTLVTTVEKHLFLNNILTFVMSENRGCSMANQILHILVGAWHGVEKSMNYEKNAWVWDPYSLIWYSPGITKMPIWKKSMCILARNSHFPNLCTKKCQKFASKIAIFSI